MAKSADIDARYGAIVLAPLLVFLIGEGILRFGPAGRCWSSLGASGQETGIKCHLGEAATRLDMLLSVLGISGLAVFALVLFVVETLTHFEARALRKIAAMFLLCIALGILLAFGDGALGFPWRAWDIYGKGAVGALAARLSAPAEQYLSFLTRVVDTAEVLIGLAVSAMVVGTICCVFRPAPSNGARSELVGVWQRQVKRAQVWLYVAAALLVVGLMLHNAWGRWLGACLPREEHAAHASLVASFTAYKGIEFSLFLASYYVPVMLIISRQAVAMTEAGVRRKGLHIPVADSVKMLVAILAPFLAGLLGPAGEALKGLAGK